LQTFSSHLVECFKAFISYFFPSNFYEANMRQILLEANKQFLLLSFPNCNKLYWNEENKELPKTGWKTNHNLAIVMVYQKNVQNLKLTFLRHCSRYVALHHVILFEVVSHDVIKCYVLHVTSFYSMSHHVTSFLPDAAWSINAMLRRIILCNVTSCDVILMDVVTYFYAIMRRHLTYRRAQFRCNLPPASWASKPRGNPEWKLRVCSRRYPSLSPKSKI